MNDQKSSKSTLQTVTRFAMTICLCLAACWTFISSAQAQTSVSTDWASRLTFNGDLRFRLQRDVNGAYPVGTNNTAENDLSRIRARLGMTAKINDSLLGVLRLSTGNNQYSANATLGQGSASGTGFFARKPFLLDYAYFDYKVLGMENMDLLLGKSPMSFWTPGKTALVWNPDSTFEGFQYKWAVDMGGSLKPWVVANYAAILDRINQGGNATAGASGNASTTDGNDVTIAGLQVGTTWQTESNWLTGAVGYYSYSNIKGLPSSTTGLTNGNNGNTLNYNLTNAAFNNSIDAAGNFINAYKLLNIGAEYGMNFSFAPATLFADYVQNSEPGSENKGMLVGAKLGALKAPGTWYVMYDYRDNRKDATLAAYADPVFLNGGTDVFGSQVQLGYQGWTNAALVFDYDTGKKLVSNNGGVNYELYTADLIATF
jgi:hypothetical protein